MEYLAVCATEGYFVGEIILMSGKATRECTFRVFPVATDSQTLEQEQRLVDVTSGVVYSPWSSR